MCIGDKDALEKLDITELREKADIVLKKIRETQGILDEYKDLRDLIFQIMEEKYGVISLTIDSRDKNT